MSIDGINRRLDKLDALHPAETPRRVLRLIIQEAGETHEEAIARWCVENPGETPPAEDDVIILRGIVSPHANAE
jgi:hypothetical protein